ncbi:MAG: two-component system response regulator, partial [Candidatus Riflebacteria bacterium HGW-Riflebacteria-2]
MTQEDRPLILIVDDKPGSLQAVAEILGSNGYRLALAESGPAALNFVSEKEPDLILLDIVMPGMDGFEVLRNLKESEKTASI